MLKTRVITALVMMAVLLPSIFLLPQAAWALLVAAFIGVAAWEWGALLKWQESGRRLLGVGVAGLCATLSILDPAILGSMNQFAPATGWVLAFYVVSAAFWCLLMPFWLRSQWALGGGASGLLVGAIVLLPTWLAIVQLRTLGPWALLGVFAVVWMADIAAYFAGRTFGLRFTKNKLAPSISPGKSWEGVWGGMAGVLLLGLCWVVADAHWEAAVPSLYSRLWAQGAWLLLLGALFMACMSVVGDLIESLVKRSAGAKDSSNLLPGHGGVLDRVDALLPTLPIAMMLTRLVS